MKSCFLLATAALISATLSANAATVTLFDDNFDADSAGVPTSPGYTTVTDLTHWFVTQGNVDALNAVYGCIGCIDLDGSDSPAPAVLVTKTALNFYQNFLYTVSLFFSGGSAEETVTIGVNGGAVPFLAGNGASVYTISASPPSDLTGVLTISLSGPADNSGPYLDRVLITYEDTLAPVPLPAAAPLLLAGLGALGLFARRRRMA